MDIRHRLQEKSVAVASGNKIFERGSHFIHHLGRHVFFDHLVKFGFQSLGIRAFLDQNVGEGPPVIDPLLASEALYGEC